MAEINEQNQEQEQSKAFTSTTQKVTDAIVDALRSPNFWETALGHIFGNKTQREKILQDILKANGEATSRIAQQKAEEVVSDTMGANASGTINAAKAAEIKVVLGESGSLLTAVGEWLSQIAQIDLDEKFVGPIKNIIDSVGKIMASMGPLSQEVGDMKNLPGVIDEIKKIIEGVSNIDIKEPNGKDPFDFISKRVNSIHDIVELLSTSSFDKDHIKRYSETMKGLTDVVKQLSGLKIEEDSKNVLDNKKTIQYIRSLLVSMGDLIKWLSTQNITVDSKIINDYNKASGDILKITKSIKELNSAMSLVESVRLQISQALIKFVINRFAVFSTEINDISKSTGKIDLSNINNNLKSITNFIDGLEKLNANPASILLMKLKYRVIGKIIGDFITFLYGKKTGTEEVQKGNKTIKQDVYGGGLIKKLGSHNEVLQTGSIEKNIETLNSLLKAIGSLEGGIVLWVTFQYKRWVINNIIKGFISFMYGSTEEDQERSMSNFMVKVSPVGLIDKVRQYRRVLNTKTLVDNIAALNTLLTSIASIGRGLNLKLNFKAISEAVKSFLVFMYGEKGEVVNNESNEGLIKTLNKHKEALDIGIIQANTNQLVTLLESLRSIASIKNLGLFLISPIMSMVKASVNAIVTFVDWFTKRSRGIADMTNNLRIITNTIKEIRNVVVQMDLLMLILVASVPLFIIFLIASPAVLLGLVEISLMILALRGLVYLIEVLRFPPNAPALFAAIDIMLGLMVLTIVELLLFALFSDKLWKNFANICKGIIALAGIAVALVVTSALISLGAPFFALGAIGAVAMFAVVGAFLFIAGALYLLQFIQLDEDKIMENVHKITRITRSIINELSMNPGKPAEEQTDRGFLEILGGSVSNALTSIFSFVTVAAAGLAVAAMLIMSGMLFLIQLIPLNEGKILENVRKIIDTVLGINEMLNSPAKKAEEDEESKEMWYDVILYALKPVATFVNTLFSMATLLVATITVAAIMLIAGMLRFLQTINLNPEQIRNNVRTVIGCVQTIHETLNEPVEEGQRYNHGIMGEILRFISPPIGNLWDSIVSMFYLAFALINVGAVMLIAKMLNTLSDIDPSAIEKAQENARLVMTTAKNIQAIITSAQADKEEKSKKPWWAKALGVLGMGDLAEAIVNISSLATMMITIGCLAKLAEQLNSLKLNRGSANAVVQDARTIVNAATLIYNYLNTANFSNMKENKMEGWTNNLKSQEKLLKQIKSVGKMEEGFMESLSLDRLAQGSNIATETLRLTNEILKNFDAISVDPDSIQEKLGLIDMMNDSIRGIATVSDSDVKNTERLTDSYIRFINRLDQADLQRLNIAERMMRSWAYIAQAIDNDFDKLVLMMSDKMMPMLDTMNKTMEGVSKVQGDIIKQLTDPTLAAITPNGGDFGQSGAGQTGGSSGGSSGGGGESEQGTASELLNGGAQTTGDSKLDVNTPWIPNNNTPTIAGSGGINNTSVRNGNDTGVKGLSGKGATKQEPVYAIIVGIDM